MAKRHSSRDRKPAPVGPRRRLAKRRQPAARKPSVARRASKSIKRGATRRAEARKAQSARKGTAKARTARQGRPRPRAASAKRAPKSPRLDRTRRTLNETALTPPSSLNLDRHASAARTGRAELQESLHEHTGMTPALTGGDVDADWENAYFSGDEAPGGDNPTPDQDIVDDIGRSLGVQYQDDEELRGSDKVVERDKHRWELDPASSEDYKERE